MKNAYRMHIDPLGCGVRRVDPVGVGIKYDLEGPASNHQTQTYSLPIQNYLGGFRCYVA